LNKTYRVTVVVQVSLTFVELTVTWDSDSTLNLARGDSVTSASTEVVLVTVDVTAGTRDEHSLAAAVLDARQPSPRKGDASQALTLALALALKVALALEAELALSSRENVID
jgi:hypothetical protein